MAVPDNWPEQLRDHVSRLMEASRLGFPDSAYMGDEPFPGFVLTERADSWDAFTAWVAELQGSWGFRGQRDSGWVLNTSLDRAVRREYSSPTGSGHSHLPRAPEIRNLLFRFQQQAHQYIPQPPQVDDLTSWLALMQHHGVPTPFLDWTRSPYVGLYFAMEEDPADGGCAVWGIDLQWLDDKARKLLPSGFPAAVEVKQCAEYVNGWILSDSSQVAILAVHPSRLDARMAAQQGFFLCKLYHQVFFSQVLMSMIMHPIADNVPDLPSTPVVRRLVIDKDRRIEFLKNLRDMNIHRASLFPGLDGFGQSLKLDLEIRVRGS